MRGTEAPPTLELVASLALPVAIMIVARQETPVVVTQICSKACHVGQGKVSSVGVW